MTSAGDGVRVGMIGGGFMARVHSRAARRAGAQLRALVASTPSSSYRAAEELGFARRYRDVAELLADEDIDVVHICTPNATHVALAAAALAAGKNVVCEKPIGIDGTEADRLRRRAEDSGLTLTVPFVYRYHPLVREMRHRIAVGGIGRLFSLSGVYLQDWLLDESDDDWRADPRTGGPSRAFADIGSHLVDLVEFVTGERIVELSARTRRVHERRLRASAEGNEDIAALLIALESGALGTLLVSQVSPGRKNGMSIEIAGAAESLRFEQENPEVLWIGRRGESALVRRDPVTLSPPAARLASLPAGHPQGYQDAFDAFIADSYRAVRGERLPEGTPQAADGARAAILTDAVLASGADGGWVRTPVDAPRVRTPHG